MEFREFFFVWRDFRKERCLNHLTGEESHGISLSFCPFPTVVYKWGTLLYRNGVIALLFTAKGEALGRKS